MFIVDYFVQLILWLCRYFKSPVEMDRYSRQIFVKWMSDTVPVRLNKDWTVLDLKQSLSEIINVNPKELHIIFAGKELCDETNLQDCDVGEQSVIHAVPSRKLPLKLTVTRKSEPIITPLNLCEDLSEISEEKKTESKKAHFFVYCSDPCKCMNPGKLRVRCSTCKEGTLAVQRDPECWEDVLQPGRVQGVCQAEDCDGTVAEFYFKCAKHITSPGDFAVALHLIRNNFKDVPCIACTDIRPLVLVFPCEPKHVICLDCFKLYCVSYLNERKFIQDQTLGYTLNCPAGCPNSLITEPHHFKLLGDEEYSRFQRFGAEECLLQAGGILCPRPGCGAGLIPDIECNRVVCAAEAGHGCGFVFCRLCLQGYHLGTCERHDPDESNNTFGYVITDERAGTSRWEEDTNNTIRITTKPCPKCRTPTERSGGCMHMFCTRPQCGFHWCWVCQDEWARDCMANHWFL